jgi:SAM-dependent methyltransferase
MDYPVFSNPDQYLRRREGRLSIWRRLKRYYEFRAISRCLRHTTDIHSVCDVPCGPGRLFEYWAKQGWAVHGLDLSEQMIAAATTTHQHLGLEGDVRLENVFESNGPESNGPESNGPESNGPESPDSDMPAATTLPAADLYASVRFIYYFERDRRIELLKILSKASNHYVLIQYKSLETRKGRKNAARQKDQGVYTKYFCRHRDIRGEIEASGMKFVCIEIIDQSSDRVFALALNQ